MARTKATRVQRGHQVRVHHSFIAIACYSFIVELGCPCTTFRQGTMASIAINRYELALCRVDLGCLISFASCSQSHETLQATQDFVEAPAQGKVESSNQGTERAQDACDARSGSGSHGKRRKG